MYNVFDVLMLTMVIVLQTPGLDEVLRELGVGEERDAVGDEHHIALGELLQLQVHLANLNQASRLCSSVTCYLDYLCIKRIMVEQVCAMKLFVVGLIHSYNVILSSEYLNLVIVLVKTNVIRNHPKCVCVTSSATSGPLLTKSPCLVTATRVI